MVFKMYCNHLPAFTSILGHVPVDVEQVLKKVELFSKKISAQKLRFSEIS